MQQLRGIRGCLHLRHATMSVAGWSDMAWALGRLCQQPHRPRQAAVPYHAAAAVGRADHRIFFHWPGCAVQPAAVTQLLHVHAERRVHARC
jgi:hypothetical protein